MLYLFILYCGFPASVVLGFLLTISPPDSNESMETSASWNPTMNDLYMCISITFLILTVIILWFIWKDMRENRFYSKRAKARAAKHANDPQGYIQCDYCGAWVDKTSATCGVCGMATNWLDLQRQNVPTPAEPAPYQPTPMDQNNWE